MKILFNIAHNKVFFSNPQTAISVWAIKSTPPYVSSLTGFLLDVIIFRITAHNWYKSRSLYKSKLTPRLAYLCWPIHCSGLGTIGEGPLRRKQCVYCYHSANLWLHQNLWHCPEARRRMHLSPQLLFNDTMFKNKTSSSQYILIIEKMTAGQYLSANLGNIPMK